MKLTDNLDNKDTDKDTELKHDYLSTSCLHGLHERCRKQCKFCEALCKCPCHIWNPEK